MWATKAIPSSLLAILILLAGCGNAVQSMEGIQAAIDAAGPGETIAVGSGTYEESVVVDKQLVLRGIDSGSGQPVVETDDGPAITLKANGIVLEGFSARSSSGWTGDAGILVLSDDNIIRNNVASGNGAAGMVFQLCRNNTIYGNVADGNGNEGLLLKNCSQNILEANRANKNKYGLKLVASDGNQVQSNTFSANRLGGMHLENCQGNVLQGNQVHANSDGITLENSRDNVVKANDLVGNDKGIDLSFRNDAGNIKSAGKGVSISYNSWPAEKTVSSNNTLYLNNLTNKKNVNDDSLNYWDNGAVGNNYSDFNDPGEGCTGKKICDAEHHIPGGSSVDRYPIAAPVKIRGRSTGPGGAVLQLFQSGFVPKSSMRVNFTSPASKEAWIEFVLGNETEGEQYLGQNTTADIILVAPEGEGAYRLRMYDGNGTEIMSIPFNVTIPTISASPLQVTTCEKIYVAFSGASGQNNDWIGMYRSGASDAVSRQLLGGNAAGNLAFSTQDGGTYEFRMFEAGASAAAVTSNSVQVDARASVKVIAEPSRVAPGGTITVTFWGAPASGTGVLGMYGMTRPDKFHIEKRATGSRNCGSMTFRAPGAPGQYDFRLFHDDVNRPLLAQSNVVTVG